ncbi:PREDICTED: heavy metal-associated isoprenylated plant protein 31-like [Ipomoea nil]|uniref:heavy metal-associated isoprenylated plant protein 31-like n=1 Tax=Ipomoea nil TaxID=35883 RepID=UPI00090183BF|nr:PREDICTED: heavy metal-associated isoprenylated plant protein 31-like [Ipomoea nil]
MSMVVVRVPTLDCDGCAAKIRKALLKLKGVDDVDIEMEMKKITVRGYGLEERKVVKAIKRAGKVAEPWPYPVGSSHLASFYRYPTQIAAHYYQSMISSADLAAPAVHAFFHTPALYSVAVAPDEAFASIFSDDNPHACTIM